MQETYPNEDDIYDPDREQSGIEAQLIVTSDTWAVVEAERGDDDDVGDGAVWADCWLPCEADVRLCRELATQLLEVVRDKLDSRQQPTTAADADLAIQVIEAEMERWGMDAPEPQTFSAPSKRAAERGCILIVHHKAGNLASLFDWDRGGPGHRMFRDVEAALRAEGLHVEQLSSRRSAIYRME